MCRHYGDLDCSMLPSSFCIVLSFSSHAPRGSGSGLFAVASSHVPVVAIAGSRRVRCYGGFPCPTPRVSPPLDDCRYDDQRPSPGECRIADYLVHRERQYSPIACLCRCLAVAIAGPRMKIRGSGCIGGVMQIEALKAEALRLPAEQRAQLAAELLESLEPLDADI